MVLSEKIEEWQQHSVGESYSVTDDLTLLKTDEGFYSKEQVVYNPTLDQVVINTQHPMLVNGARIDTIFGSVKTIPDDLKTTVAQVMKNGQLRNILLPIQRMHVLDIISEDIHFDKKVERICAATESFHKGEGGLSIELTLNGASDCLKRIIDWQETLKGMSLQEIVQVFIQIKGGTYFTLPTDFRRTGDGKFADVTFEFLASHPFFELVRRIKFIKGVVVPSLDGKGLKKELTDYLNALHDQSGSIVRSQMSRFIQQLNQLIGNILIKLAFENVLFVPYLTPNLSPKGKLAEVLDMTTPMGILLDKMLAKLGGDTQTANNRSSKRRCYSFLRGIYISSDVRDIQDLPLNWALEISATLKNYYSSKGYATSTGMPLHVLRDLMDIFDETLDPAVTRFDRTFLNHNMNIRRDNQDKNRTSGKFLHAKDIMGDEIISQMRIFVEKEGSKHNVNAFNHFIDWVQSISNGDLRFKCMDDFSAPMFNDPLSTNAVSVTFFQYIDGLEVGLNTSKVIWGAIHNLFMTWANAKRLQTQLNIGNPVERVSKMYSSEGKRSITVRDAMPSSLHELCIQALTENDYQFYVDNFASAKERLVNRDTGQYETVENKTVARCVHFLLLVPLRGYQSRWLDEGLLDDKLWDMEQGCYVENTHPLANFDYGDGTTHCSRYSSTGIYRNDANFDNENLKLYINTNKTQTAGLRKKGHTGYDLPWPFDSGVDQLDEVWNVIAQQKGFNAKYAPDVKTPVRVTDEDSHLYKPSLRHLLPYFVPLFRRTRPTVSASDPSRTNLYLPVTGDMVRKVFYAVLKEAEKRYKDRYPQFASQMVAFNAKGEPNYDVHSLRVFGVTELIEHGMPIEVVQMIVGHSVAVMTAYYNKIRTNRLKDLLIKANESKGFALQNQKAMYDKYEQGEADVLIALFDLVQEWNGEKTNTTGINPAPDLSVNGAHRVINGGICQSFDCKTGGIKIIASKAGEKYEITPVEGGDFRCGNCRYWQSGPRFLDEQIYHLNLVGEEIETIVEEKKKCMQKMQEAYSDPDLKDKHFIAERWERKANEMGYLLAYRVWELRRREIMMHACIEKAGIENDSNPNLPALPFDDMPPEIVGKWKKVSRFDGCMERTMQAAVLGEPVSDSEVSMRKLEMFVHKALHTAGEGNNPFIFKPNDEVKRVALLYALANSCEKLGRSFTDDEFENPQLLQQTLGLENMNQLIGDPLSLKNEQGLLEG